MDKWTVCLTAQHLTAIGHSQLLAQWPRTHSRILSRLQQAAQTVLGVYLRRTCLLVTSASSTLGVLTITHNTNPRTQAHMHSLTHSLTHSVSGYSEAASSAIHSQVGLAVFAVILADKVITPERVCAVKCRGR